MRLQNPKFSFILALLNIWKLTNCERLHEQIYSSIEGGAACFRRLNGTHQAGCASSSSGAVGVVHLIKDIDEANWLVFNSSAGPYVGVVNTVLFHDTIELLMGYSSNIAGLLIYDNATKRPTSFSQESRCPNEYSSGPGSQCSSIKSGGIVWNERGTGLLRRDIPFPIFYLPSSQIDQIEKIESCYQRYNSAKNNQKGKSLCSVQLNSFMFAAVNSVVCLRRSATSALLSPTKMCDPLGDHNVYYSLFPRKKSTSKKSITLVTARIDSASLFDGISPGAASSVVGLVTLLTAAATVAKMVSINDTSDENIVWTLFNGEAFDYIGSQRIAYDINKGVWPAGGPITPSDIRLHLEIGQIGGSIINKDNDSSWSFHAYTPSYTVMPETITLFLAKMLNNLKQYKMSITPEITNNLPPSSLHSFRRILKNFTETGELPELLFEDHKDTFTNMFYNSALDDYQNIGFIYHNISINNGTFIPTDDLLKNGTMTEQEAQVKIAHFATALSRTLYEHVMGEDYTGNFSSSAHMVDELLYCFLRSQSCRLVAAAEYGGATSGSVAVPAPLYVGVATWQSGGAALAGHVLALLTGTHLALNRTQCDAAAADSPKFSYYWLKGWNHTGVCIQTTMNFSQAVSPAFIISDYKFESGEYSTWTESVWQTMWARVFVASSGDGARLAAITGTLSTLVAAVITVWLQRHRHRLFSTTPPNPAATGILRSVNC